MVERVTSVALVAFTFVQAVVVFRHAMWRPSCDRIWLVMPCTNSTRIHFLDCSPTRRTCFLISSVFIFIDWIVLIFFKCAKHSRMQRVWHSSVHYILQSTLSTLNAYTAPTYCNKTTATSTDRITIYIAVHIHYLRHTLKRYLYLFIKTDVYVNQCLILPRLMFLKQLHTITQ